MKPPDEQAEDAYLQTAKLTDFLGWHAGTRPTEDDPAETFHEASKNVPRVMPHVSSVVSEITADPTVGTAGATIHRSVKQNPALPTIALPAPAFSSLSVGDAIARRRSRRGFGPQPLTLLDLSTLLHGGYGVTAEKEIPAGQMRFRSVPSGGGIYPLEIYPVIRNVEGMQPGLYHFDPFRQVLETLRELEVEGELAELLIDLPDVTRSCAVVFFIAGIFWRTRFKYALRGYRWVLIEAGHVGQNLSLTAESLGLSLFPNGGFWDREVDAFLGLDGVNESVVYSLIAGSTA